MTPSYWALSLTYWLHMLATARHSRLDWRPGEHLNCSHPGGSSGAGFANVRQLPDPLAAPPGPLGWTSLLVLVGTGLFQMSANPNYSGTLAILLKHLVFLAMTVVSAYLTWGIMPRLQRLAIRQAVGQDGGDLESLHRQENLVLKLNLALGIIVLALTALARAAP